MNFDRVSRFLFCRLRDSRKYIHTVVKRIVYNALKWHFPFDLRGLVFFKRFRMARFSLGKNENLVPLTHYCIERLLICISKYY